MFEPRDLIGSDELRELMDEAELDVDADTFERILAAVQPMRAMLRSGGAGRRRSILRGAALTAGWKPPGAPASASRPLTRPEPVAPERRYPTLRHLVARLGAIYVAVVAAFFALMTMTGPDRGPTIAFGAGSAALLVLAVTGRGLGGLSTSPEEHARTGTIVGTVLLLITGAGPLLLASVGSVFHPGLWGDGDVLTRAGQVIGLVTLYVIGSHLRAIRRAD